MEREKATYCNPIFTSSLGSLLVIISFFSQPILMFCLNFLVVWFLFFLATYIVYHTKILDMYSFFLYFFFLFFTLLSLLFRLLSFLFLFILFQFFSFLFFSISFSFFFSFFLSFFLSFLFFFSFFFSFFFFFKANKPIFPNTLPQYHTP